MQNILEAIVGNGQQPNKFWIVLDIPCWESEEKMSDHNRKRLTDIQHGILHGVRGISESRQILTGWWLIARNAAIVMDAGKVVDSNDVEKIDYEDLDYLCSDNFRPLYRIWDKERVRSDRGKDHEQMMQNLLQYVSGEMRSINDYAAHILSYYGIYAPCKTWNDDPSGVHDFDSAAAKVADILINSRDKYDAEQMAKNVSVNDVREALRKALRRVGRVYADEAEWLVQSEALKIPQGSTMLIGINAEAAKGYAEWKEWSADPANENSFKYMGSASMYENHDRLMILIEKYRLRDYYKVVLVDSKRFEEMRPAVTTRRREKG